MGELPCDKKNCFYCINGACSNIAVSVPAKCDLYLDTQSKKVWRPQSISKPPKNDRAFNDKSRPIDQLSSTKVAL